MFAFAIWERTRARCSARATAWATSPSTTTGTAALFVFASEIKALLEHPAISAEFEETLLPEYLAFGYVSEERTLFSRHPQADARSSSARSICRRARPALRIEQYWDVPEPADVRAARRRVPGFANAASAWKRPCACA